MKSFGSVGSWMTGASNRGSERLDVGDLVEQLCTRFDFQKESVREIVIQPSAITFSLLEKNYKGRPFLKGDAIATREWSYKVTT